MTDERFNPYDEVAALLADYPCKEGPRMSFRERCAVFALSQMGAKAPMLCKAFGTTRQTVNYIIRCDAVAIHGVKPRYSDVADEFRRLGGEDFIAQYVTPEITARMARIRSKALHATDDRSPKGPVRSARQHSWDIAGAFQVAGSWWRVDWTEGDGHPNGEGGPGWRFAECLDQFGMLAADHYYQGKEAVGGNPYGETPKAPFKTSTIAWKSVNLALT